jgi:formamidopyrimidine-DNA glycosylase
VPEGHSVHRIARQFSTNFVGRRVAVSSPQGRFDQGASLLDGHVLADSRAIGKHLFLQFDDERFLHVHLGMYGAWDFAGEISTDATMLSANGRMGQTNQRGTFLDAQAPSIDDAALAGASRAAVPADVSPGGVPGASLGAPRRARIRMAENEAVSAAPAEFPPEPVGAVRVRLLTGTAVADLRGATTVEVLDGGQVQAVLDRLGPDPLIDKPKAGERRFVRRASAIARPIGLVLMDQEVVSGIGNVYRAEILFRQRLDPHTPAKQVSEEKLGKIWRDWSKLLRLGVETGQMMTRDRLSPAKYAQAMANRDDRHWVYHRTGLPCRVSRTPIVMEMMADRKLYWCPSCQT